MKMNKIERKDITNIETHRVKNNANRADIQANRDDLWGYNWRCSKISFMVSPLLPCPLKKTFQIAELLALKLINRKFIIMCVLIYKIQ